MSNLVSISQDEEQGLRLVKLLDESTNTLRDYLLAPYNTGKITFEDALLKEEKKLRKILRQAQIDIIFPKSGKTNPNEYDVSMLQVLLRVVRKIPQPKTGWHNEPLTTDQSDSAHIVRIHISRNNLQHSRLSKEYAEYTSYLNSIGASMVALGADINIVNKLMKQPIDGNTVQLFNQKLNELQEADDKITELEKKIEEMESCYEKDVWFDVLPLISSFTGRKTDVKDLHSLITSHDEGKIGTVVTGFAGTGKTSLALYYCYEHREHYNNNIIWLNSSSSASLKGSFMKLASHLKIISDDERGSCDIELVVTRIYKFFSDRDVLFVFDNADSADIPIDYLPKNMSPLTVKPSIMITSRISCWGQRFHEKGITSLSRDETMELIRNFLPQELILEKESPEMLYDLLKGFPIALQQSIAYMKFNAMTISEYLEQFKNAEEDYLLSFSADDVMYQHNFYGSLMMTLSSLRNTKHAVALELVNLIAFMDGISIDKKILQQSTKYKTRELEPALMILEQLSIIRVIRNYQKREITLSVHSLVQLVIRNELIKASNHNECIDQLFKIFRDIISGKEHVNHYDFGKPWIHHVVYLHQTMPDDETVKMNLAHRMIDIFHALSNMDTEDILCNILQTVKNFYRSSIGENCDELLQIYDIEIHSLMALHKYKEALKICFELTNDETSSNQINLTSYMKLRTDTAFCLSALGRHSEALQMYLPLLTEKRDILGKYHNSTLVTENNIAYEFSKLFEYQRALDYLEPTLRKYESLPSYESDPNYFLAIDNKAKFLMKLGKYQEAKITFESVIKNDIYQKRIKLYGETNSLLLRSKLSLAFCLYILGFYKDSLTIALEIEQHTKSSYYEWGRNRDIYFASQNYKANSFLQLGNYEKAFKVYTHIKEGRLDLTRNDYSTYLIDDLNLGICLHNMGMYSKALNAFEHVYDGYNKNGERNEPLLHAQYRLANCLIDVGRYSDAIHLLTDIKKSSMFAENDLYMLRTYSSIARCQHIQGKITKSKSHCNYVFTHANNLSEWHAVKINTTITFAKCLIEEGLLTESLTTLENIIDKSVIELGSKHPLILQAKLVIAIVLSKQIKKSEASDMFKQIESDQDTTIGADHPHTLQTSFNNVIHESEDINVKETKQKLQDIYNQQSRKLDYDHVDALLTNREIASCLMKEELYHDAITILKYVKNQLKLKFGTEYKEYLKTKTLYKSCLKKNI